MNNPDGTSHTEVHEEVMDEGGHFKKSLSKQELNF